MKGKGEYIGNVGRRQMGAYEVFANRAVDLRVRTGLKPALTLKTDTPPSHFNAFC
ncbi:hypothetical protein AGMMS49960_15570 [Betaproteobacteria bacterium]|nr:hypothetical protein AGMMS49543_04640 [Betaproteobacteria bacterium]GHU02705.1 hypothetical protein AGMMS49960_15570 [Betaproteobacteria bacterium]GHU20356.1 hypothetical protein AGMMS50243_14740 [Betaproteobacteria bacterium]